MKKKSFTPNYLLNQINWLRKWSLNLAGVYLLFALIIDYSRYSSDILSELFFLRLVYMVLPLTFILLAFYYQIKFSLSRKTLEKITLIAVVTIGIGHSEILSLLETNGLFFPKTGITIMLIYVGLLLALPISFAILGSTVIIIFTCYTYYSIGIQFSDVLAYSAFYVMFSSCCILTSLACLRILKANLKLIKKIDTQANTDDLTGLYNRRYFYTQSERLIKQSFRNDNPMAFILIDLDNFKLVNDILGHNYGDQLLVKFAALVDKNCRKPHDFMARIGGDEFVLVAYDVTNEYIHKVCQNIIEKFNSMVMKLAAKDPRVNVSLSIGVAENKAGKNHPIDMLMEVADKALYQIKHNGKNNYAVSDKSFYKNTHSSSQLLNSVKTND